MLAKLRYGYLHHLKPSASDTGAIPTLAASSGTKLFLNQEARLTPAPGAHPRACLASVLRSSVDVAPVSPKSVKFAWLGELTTNVPEATDTDRPAFAPLLAWVVAFDARKYQEYGPYIADPNEGQGTRVCADCKERSVDTEVVFVDATTGERLLAFGETFTLGPPGSIRPGHPPA